MFVIGSWKLVYFEHWFKKGTTENKMIFSKRLNQFQSNYQTLILNKDFTFSIQCLNKNFDLISKNHGNFTINENQLLLIHNELNHEQFELLTVNRRLLSLEQQFYSSKSNNWLKKNECHFYRFGFVKI